jgi:alkaline phosphatase D
MERRSFLRAGAAAVGVGAAGPAIAACTGPDFLAPPVWAVPWNGSVFSLGVLAGLHSHDEVVLWTRVDPDRASGVTSVRWEMASDHTMNDIVATGSESVGPDTVFTVKVKPSGLDPDRSYWFRFATPAGDESPVGRARTLPAPGAVSDRLRLAFASCQNWSHGWFSAWDGIAAEDVDGVVFLGDYIYESAGFIPGRSVRLDPIGHSADLDSYRAKYRLYRSDPSIQRAHSAHPIAPVWDDHEFQNNYNAADIAADPARSTAAYRAWFEYMPVWPIDGTRIHRTLRWGALAEIFLLDTRQYRDPQPGPPGDGGSLLGIGHDVAVAASPSRSLLGPDQRSWLTDGLASAQTDGVTWKLVGSQVMIHPWRLIDLDTPEIRQLNPQLVKHDGVYLNLDSWDGYQHDRDVVLSHLADNSIRNTSFLTGDVHSFWQGTLRSDFDDVGSPYVVNEFVGGSISSSSFDLAGDLVYGLEQSARSWHPPFRYVDFRRRGYGLLECTPTSMDVSFRVSNSLYQGSPTATSVTFSLADGDPVPAVTY